MTTSIPVTFNHVNSNLMNKTKISILKKILERVISPLLKTFSNRSFQNVNCTTYFEKC